MIECSDEYLMQVAHILGSSSAAAAAMKERDKRKEQGEEVVILWDRDNGRLLVGPPLEVKT